VEGTLRGTIKIKWWNCKNIVRCPSCTKFEEESCIPSDSGCNDYNYSVKGGIISVKENNHIVIKVKE